jgi:hypothetical protein
MAGLSSSVHVMEERGIIQQLITIEYLLSCERFPKSTAKTSE